MARKYDHRNIRFDVWDKQNTHMKGFGEGQTHPRIRKAISGKTHVKKNIN